MPCKVYTWINELVITKLQQRFDVALNQYIVTYLIDLHHLTCKSLAPDTVHHTFALIHGTVS